MEFFKIWQTKGGVIGVNRMSLGDLIGANIMVLVIYFLLLMLVVQLLPILLISFYVILLLNNRLDDESGAYDTQQRLMINILTIISVIYFLLDFHFGWLSFSIFSVAVSKETFDSFAILNLSIGLVSTLLFFLGHEFYKQATTPLIRLAMFVLIVYFGIKFTRPISSAIINNVITQYNDAEIQKNRDELKLNDELNSDENREKSNAERKQKELEKEQKLKDFDKEYAKKYLKN
jgi:hypothetical protein